MEENLKGIVVNNEDVEKKEISKEDKEKAILEEYENLLGF